MVEREKEARKLRIHLIVLVSALGVLLLAAGIVLQIRVGELVDKLQARCEDTRDARKWVTDELDMVNYVILTRRADDPELVARAEALEKRKLTEFEPVNCD